IRGAAVRHPPRTTQHPKLFSRGGCTVATIGESVGQRAPEKLSRLGVDEHNLYVAAREARLAADPEYIMKFGRPSTAAAVWDKIPKPLHLDVKAFWSRSAPFAHRRLSGNDAARQPLTVKTALVVALDAAISTGRGVARRQNRGAGQSKWRRRPFTLNVLF